MRIIGKDNKSFELWVVDYQFPHDNSDEYDSNWLRIGIRLMGFKKEWITSDPSLLTWELKSLIDWLEDILIGNAAKVEIAFIEQNLKFELIDRPSDGLKIRTYLSLESKPDWYSGDETFHFD